VTMPFEMPLRSMWAEANLSALTGIDLCVV
jgi:hypothetical protein